MDSQKKVLNVKRACHTLLPSLHWGELVADFYPTAKAALRHESADLEGLGCHLGQGITASQFAYYAS